MKGERKDYQIPLYSQRKYARITKWEADPGASLARWETGVCWGKEGKKKKRKHLPIVIIYGYRGAQEGRAFVASLAQIILCTIILLP